jgi:hypothetical protein
VLQTLEHVADAAAVELARTTLPARFDVQETGEHARHGRATTHVDGRASTLGVVRRGRGLGRLRGGAVGLALGDAPLDLVPRDGQIAGLA